MKRSWFVAALGALAFLPLSASAQGRLHPRWEIPGFDFARDGVWRVKAGAVARRRAALLGQGQVEALNAPGLSGGVQASELVLSGTLKVPVVMLRYQDTPPADYSRTAADYDTTLFGDPPPSGRPYTLRTFYEQLATIGANPPLFSVQGKSYGWAALGGIEQNYTGTPGTCFGNPYGTSNCNGLFSGSAQVSMQSGLREALARVDTGASGVNFGLYDNDGVDGVPNSGDDDGYVDIAVFLHAAQDGACGGSTNNHIWSHRWDLRGTGSAYFTNDARSGGGNIQVASYIVQSALGGSTACITSDIMPIGTAAHELGHGLGLPDFYDTGCCTEGIGEWGLMSSGNYSVPFSPSRMEAYSLQFLGWITLRQITTSGTYTVGPVPTSDTTFLIQLSGTNPRQEYFLLESRQAVLADSSLIRRKCQQSGSPPGCTGGLLVWHVDSLKIQTGGNSVNAGSFPSIHGLKLEEADGLRQLWCEGSGCNRGDAGDPWPGVAGRTRFSITTSPAALKNSDGSPAGFALDSITQVVLDGEMSLVIRIGGITTVRSSDTVAFVSVDGANYQVFRDIFSNGSTHNLSVADTQVSGNGRTRWVFASWSDGGARQHAITAGTVDTTITATLTRAFKLIATTGANGSISSNPGGLDLTGGVFRDSGASVELTATPGGGFVFNGWAGDTATINTTLIVPMARPYTVTASFATQLAITKPTVLRAGVMGGQYADTLTATGGLGGYTWTVTSGSLPPGTTFATNGVIQVSELSQTGTFNFTAQVTAGAQSQSQAFSITVSAPVLTTQTVVSHVLDQSTGTLTFAQQRYLDLLGNNNGILDVGDFLAWVIATGAPLSAEVLQALQAAELRKGGRP